MLTQIKLYVYGAILALVGLLAGLLKFYKGKARVEEKRAEIASESLSRQKDIQREDHAIEKKYERRRSEAAKEGGKEPEKSNVTSIFADPNQLFDDDPDSR